MPDSQKPPAFARGISAALGLNVIRQKWPTFLICAILLAALVAFALGASPLLQLILMVSALVWFVTLIGNIGFAIGRWNELRLKALVPVSICLLTLPVAYVVGHVTAEVHFRYFLLPRFEQLVTEIRAANMSRDTTVEISSKVARIVLARRDKENQLQIEFVTGLGFPVKHSGYLYVENEDIESDPYLSSRWPHASKVKPQWFRVGD